MSLAENLKAIKQKIAAAARASGRDAKDIRLVAVTKKVAVERVREAFALGLTDFAENYVQEAVLKIVGMGEPTVKWHFIGHLQTNKVKTIAGRIELIHSIDRKKILDEVSARSQRPQAILLEVNLAGEESKTGAPPEEVAALIEAAQNAPRIELRGLMFMPPINLAPIAQGQYFARAREFREQMAKNVSAPHSLLELSMGTSHDFEAAIREGATIVRLGTSLFGERTAK